MPFQDRKPLGPLPPQDPSLRAAVEQQLIEIEAVAKNEESEDLLEARSRLTIFETVVSTLEGTYKKNKRV